MSDRNMDVVPGARAPVLGRVLLARTHELNQDYVELLLAERSSPAAVVTSETLPSGVLDALGRLDCTARAVLAACPFSLFSLSFDDHRFWSSVLGSSRRPESGQTSIEACYRAVSTAPMQAAFCEVALFLAWRTAQSHRLAARFLFAMPDNIVAQLVHTPLWRIRRVAIDYPGLLTPRWPLNPAFWPDLVRFAATADARLEAAQLLGNQLIASELDGSLPHAGRPRIGLRVRRP